MFINLNEIELLYFKNVFLFICFLVVYYGLTTGKQYITFKDTSKMHYTLKFLIIDPDPPPFPKCFSSLNIAIVDSYNVLSLFQLKAFEFVQKSKN